MIRIVEQILQSKKIDINQIDTNNSTALHQACSKGYTSIVKALLNEPNIQVNIQDDDGISTYILINWTPLICAVSEGNIDIVKLLIERNDVDLNLQEKDGVYSYFN